MNALERYWHAPAPPERLAVVRALTGAFATVYLCVRLRDVADYAQHATADFRPVGIVTLLDAPLPAAVTWLLAIAGTLAAAAFAAGWRYRIVAPICAALLLWLFSYRSSWGMIFHTDDLLVLQVIALAAAPCAADAYSLDARSLDAPSLDTSRPEDARYGWPLRLLCAVTVATYLVAGVTKLRITGIAWLTTDFLRDHVAFDAVRKAELGDSHSALAAWLVENHPGWFKPMAAFTLSVELGAPLAMVHRRLAAPWVASAILLHAGVLAVMTILFPYALSAVPFACFFRAERLAQSPLTQRLLARFRGTAP